MTTYSPDRGAQTVGLLRKRHQAGRHFIVVARTELGGYNPQTCRPDASLDQHGLAGPRVPDWPSDAIRDTLALVPRIRAALSRLWKMNRPN